MISRTNDKKTIALYLSILLTVIGLLYCASATASDAVPQISMPAHWTVVSAFQAPPEQVQAISKKLGADLRSVRNTICDINGKRVQINTIVATDQKEVEKLMKALTSVKIENALLRKNLTVYEFVGQNDVFALIQEGRNHLDTKQ